MTDLLEIHRQWIADFDRSVDDDRWDRLTPWLTENVRYIVSGSPFAVSLTGRDAVIGGLAKSVRNFDRHFDRRGWTPVSTRIFAPNGIEMRVLSQYDKAGVPPPLAFSIRGLWFFRDEKIDCMIDIYDDAEAEIQGAYGWLEAHPIGIDPSYG